MEPKTVEISNRCENFLCSHEDLANFALQLLMFGALHDLVPPICKYCNFTKINTPPWVFFTFFKIVQMLPNRATHHICLKIIVKVKETRLNVEDRNKNGKPNLDFNKKNHQKRR